MAIVDGRETVDPGSGAGFARARGDASAQPSRRDGSSSTDPSAVGPNPLERLRPVGPGAVLDGGFDLLRFRFRRLVGLAACLYVPITLFDLLLMAVIGTDAVERTPIGPAFFLLGGGDSWSWMIVVAQAVALSVLGVCVGSLAMGLEQGRDTSFRELLGIALRRSWVAVLIVPLSFLIKLLASFVPFFGWFLADAFVFLASVVAGAEGVGPLRAISRSFRLTRASYGSALLISFGSLCISQVLRISLTAGPLLLLSSFSIPESMVAGLARAGTIVLLLAEPLTACIAARAYLDLRSRSEGIDVAHRIAERFGAERSGPEIAR